MAVKLRAGIPASSAISSAQFEVICVRSEDPQQVHGERSGLVLDETSCQPKLRVVRWTVCQSNQQPRTTDRHQRLVLRPRL